MKNQLHAPVNRSAARIAFLYLAMGGLWILFSDKIARNQAAMTSISIYGGWGFAIVTAFILHWLIRRSNADVAPHVLQEQLRGENHPPVSLTAPHEELYEQDSNQSSVD